MNRTTDWICRGLGRASNGLDSIRPFLLRLRGRRRREDGHDKTGLVEGRRPSSLRRFDGDVFMIRYGSLAHSLWRAQELTLFRRHFPLLGRPVADLGCGDGSFGAALGEDIDFGIDNDAEALALCRGQKAYRRTVLATAQGIPLDTASVNGVIANSVLEHTREPEAVLAEVSRLTRPGGVFMMTVPVLGFARHLTRYFGARESERVNREYHHHNLLEADQWLRWLDAHGFEPFLTVRYQSAPFTFAYRMLRFAGERGLGASVQFQEWLWKKAEPRMVEMVRTSVQGVDDGANLFVAARRKP